MTYQEAVELKYNVHDNIIFDNNIPYHLIIAPKKQSDFLKFYNVFQHDFSIYNDNLCTHYCTDGGYILRGHITEAGKRMLQYPRL